MSSAPLQLTGIACRRLRTPGMLLENVFIEFDGPRVSVVGDFSSSWLPPGAFNARDEELLVVPGFVDVHVHGGGGIDFLTADEAGLATVSATAASGGCTTMVATTTLANDDEGLERFTEFVRILRNTSPPRYRQGRVESSARKPAAGAATAQGSAAAVAEAVAEDEVCSLPGTRIMGIHLEGPFLNPERRGAFTNRFLRPVDLKVAEKVLEICGDLLLKVTLAPELPGGAQLVQLLTSSRSAPVEVTLGHTTCDYELGIRMFGNSHVRQITHVFNAMSGLHHRTPNLITAALLDDRVCLEIIPDGLHVAPPVVKLLHKIVGAKRLIGTTDGASAAGTPPGSSFESFSGHAVVGSDCGVRRTTDHVLVGSAALMNDVYERLQTLAGIPAEDALLMCTQNPAQSINRFHQIGSIDKAKRADFAILRGTTVEATVRDGVLVYQK
ncbi:MAG: N-acetylglucosamine-6-phosphate deacetylase [Candidatus Sumerlaeaceae bacterium]